jgi:hypothetical protein
MIKRKFLRWPGFTLETRILFTLATWLAKIEATDFSMSSVSASLSMPRGGRCGNA